MTSAAETEADIAVLPDLSKEAREVLINNIKHNVYVGLLGYNLTIDEVIAAVKAVCEGIYEEDENGEMRPIKVNWGKY